MTSIPSLLERVRACGAALRRRAHWPLRLWHTVPISVAFFCCLSLWCYFSWYVPPSAFPLKQAITVPEGSSIIAVSNLLKEADVVQSRLAFRLVLRLEGRDATIQAGEYYFDRPLTLGEVAERLMAGEYGIESVRVTIPEGATSYEIAEVFARRLTRFDAVTFLIQAREREGYLFPDTYFFPSNATAAQVLEVLEQNFYDRIRDITETLQTSGRSLHEVVTMASLLEREAWSDAERRKIAGVLWRRLEIGMPLQVDAVFGYIHATSTFNPSFADLEVDSPYNTYRNAGLPPGPIGNPGLGALRAALEPEDTGALFYLHGRDGTLRLAHTFEDHVANRRRYLQ